MNKISFRKVCSSLALVCLTHGTGAFTAQMRNVNKSTGELSMGPGFGRLGGTCIAFGALLSADEFFLRLRVKETANGLEYWNGPSRVTKFPSELKINVLAYVWTCGESDRVDANSPQVILQTLRWNIEWKTGMKTRRVKRIELTLSPSSTDEWEKRIGSPSTPVSLSELRQEGSQVWNVTLAIHDQDAPLTDSLILTVMTSTERQIARFSGHL